MKISRKSLTLLLRLLLTVFLIQSISIWWSFCIYIPWGIPKTYQIWYMYFTKIGIYSFILFYTEFSDVPRSVFLCICYYALKSVTYRGRYSIVFVVKHWSQCLIIRTKVGFYVYLSTLTDIGYWLVFMCLTEVGFCFIRMYLPMTVCICVLAYSTDVGMYMYANVL